MCVTNRYRVKPPLRETRNKAAHRAAVTEIAGSSAAQRCDTVSSLWLSDSLKSRVSTYSGQSLENLHPIGSVDFSCASYRTYVHRAAAREWKGHGLARMAIKTQPPCGMIHPFTRNARIMMENELSARLLSS